MACFYPVDTPPSVPLVSPMVSNAQVVGEYGIDENDKVINGAVAPLYRPLPAEIKATIAYDHSGLRMDVHNPIDRGMFVYPPENDQIYIVSNRHNIRNVLNAFLFSPDPKMKKDAHIDIAPFQVHRIKNRIYFGDMSGEIGSLPYAPGDESKGYGFPFETLVTTRITPNLRAFYRFNYFTLLDKVQLIIRAEIDAVNEQGEYYEIKTRRHHSGMYHPLSDVLLMRAYWSQMFLGLAHSLVLGIIFDLEDDERAEVLQVHELPAHQVQQLGEIHGIMLQRFASLLRWVQEHMNEGDRKWLSYTVESGLFCLAPMAAGDVQEGGAEVENKAATASGRTTGDSADSESADSAYW